MPLAERQHRLGDFLIEREIGRGGMGVVWLAWQESMGRKVALKTLPSFSGMDPAAVARFQREAEATGRLSHPGIVPVHAVGDHEGTLYFAMDFVDGPPLSKLVDMLGLRNPDKLRLSLVEEAQIADRFPSLREPSGGTGNAYVRSCARLCAEVANALAAAHGQRIVHRDLKPNNILIHPAGRPVLVDFGLARDEMALGLTRTGEQVGTPAYMAPEQASGRIRSDARVDVWGLGAVLYELLALRPPFEGTLVEITRGILEGEPVPVCKRNPNVPVDLATIVHKCLQKDPDDRYPAIEALELDLRAFLDGKPITSRPPDRWSRWRSLYERRRRTFLGAGLVFLAVVGAAVLAGMLGSSSAKQRGAALLPEARMELLEHARAARALALYQQAEALTGRIGDVKADRVQTFRAAFERHYTERPEVLRQFSAVFDAAEREQLADLLAKLDGCGSLVFSSRLLEQNTVALFVRGFREGELDGEWRPYRAGGPLAVGEYLIRAESRDGIESVQWARVSRDGKTTFTPRWFAPGELPADAVACFDPRHGVWLAVGRHEVTRACWRAWLEAIPLPMRVEMTPLGWDGGIADAELPVQGLSFHQARTFAAWNGAHLPSAHELWLAGTAGLEGLLFPWGRKPDPGRIAADPFTMQRPEPVHTRHDGASPLGVQHVLGNVAELLSPEGLSGLHAGGGHFQDELKSLHFADGSVPLMALRDAEHQHPNAGVRLCWYLPQPNVTAELQHASERREEVRYSATGSVLCDWSVSVQGQLVYQLELNGIHRGDRSLPIPLVTPGFLQLGACTAADGHGQALPLERQVEAVAEHSMVRVQLPQGIQAGQGYRLVVRSELVPASGLVPQRDSCVLRLPLKRGRVPSLHTLTLPPGSMLLDVSPPPVRLWQDGRIVLAWEPVAQEQIETAVVRFRSDGMLARHWPVRNTVVAAVGQFLAGWNGSSALSKGALDRAFLMQPAGLDALAIEAGAPRGSLQRHRVVDVAVLGETTTVDLVADWTMVDRDGEDFTMRESAIVLQLRGDKVLRVMPRGGSDTGRYGEGGYQHAALRVRVRDVPQTQVARTQDELAELQVKLLPQALPGVHAQVVGSFADAEATAAAVLFRLSNGDSVLREGRLLSSTASDAEGWSSMDWEFGVAGTATSRERWWLLVKGRRHLLVRLVAAHADAKQSSTTFSSDAATEWFTAVRAALVVE